MRLAVFCLLVTMSIALATAAPTAVADPAGTLEGVPRIRVTDVNFMGVTISNYGFIGNNFISRAPSMEYPLGTGFEHLVCGGLWVGAHGIDSGGPFTGVSTGCLDINQGSSPAAASEFTPSGSQFRIRSTRSTSPYYHPDAVSELDLLAEFDDLTPRTAAGNPEPHRPLGIHVQQHSFAWGTGRLAHTVFFRFVLRSTGPTLSDLHVGLYTLLASGPKNAYAVWPPSSSGSTLGSWYRKAWLQYDPSLALLREHYCSALPVPDACNLGIVPYWAGLKLLIPTTASGPRATLAGWRWSPIDTARDEDVERYALMSAGTIVDLTDPDLMPITGDPVELFALGPFPALAFGDSLVIGFALLGGADVADIQINAAVAQDAWDSHFGDLPTPAAVSLASLVAEPDRVAIVWQVPEPGRAYPIDRNTPPGEWASFARPVADGAGHLAIEDRDVRSGERYGYRILTGDAGDSRVLDEVWADVPAGPGLALEGWSPNPSSGQRPRVALVLPAAGPATLELLDPAGRRIAVRRYAGLGPGRHVVDLDLERPLTPGVYFLRLVYAGRAMTRRVAVLD